MIPAQERVLQELIFQLATCMPPRVATVTEAVLNVERVIERAQKLNAPPELKLAVGNLSRLNASAQDMALIADAAYALRGMYT